MSPSALPEPLYTIEDIPGKGKGLIATHPITPGTLLISEPPLFTTASLDNISTMETDLAKIIKNLPKPSQRAFLSLQNSFKGLGDPFSNIVRSNGFPLGPSSDIGGIFPTVARLNHSCLPNCQQVWSPKHSTMLVHAVRPVNVGEELTLSYLNGGPSTARKPILLEKFRFECKCNLCSLTPEALRKSDENILRAQKLDEKIGDPKRVRNNPEKALNDCYALREVYAAEKIGDLRLPRLYYDAFQICAMHGDCARAGQFARRAREMTTVCEGEESEEVERLRELERAPEKYENFGVTGKWKSKVEDVPKEIEGKEEEFEKWLWRLRG